ncbi:hypothetical protein, partial [Salmonella enterica]|uniref:hypothetical protein n=1 Tax=Salmonella enterica TaxID=28901 RepID=UPI003CF0BC04
MIDNVFWGRPAKAGALEMRCRLHPHFCGNACLESQAGQEYPGSRNIVIRLGPAQVGLKELKKVSIFSSVKAFCSPTM